MRRRELLSTSVIVIGGLSGCLNRIPLIGMDPEEVVTEFYESQFALDVETANSHIHRGSRIESITMRDAERMQIHEYSLISVAESDTDPQPEDHFLNETEVDTEVEILYEELEQLDGAGETLEEEIDHYEDGTIPQVATVSDMAEVEAVIDYNENGRRHRPARTVQLLKDGNGWKIWTISSE